MGLVIWLGSGAGGLMQVWVDADACPRIIKEILYRAAMRTETSLILVANQPLQTPISPFIKKLRVAAGFDMADNYIAQHLQPGDIVITADILLADKVITQQGLVINPRGQLYTQENIKQTLAVRNLHAELRDSGMLSGGSAKLSEKEKQNFANMLDRLLLRR